MRHPLLYSGRGMTFHRLIDGKMGCTSNSHVAGNGSCCTVRQWRVPPVCLYIKYSAFVTRSSSVCTSNRLLARRSENLFDSRHGQKFFSSSLYSGQIAAPFSLLTQRVNEGCPRGKKATGPATNTER
jgi:hypothetical protein